MRLVAEVYKQTESFPREELYGLRNQIRRASVSVPSNIAEGQARFSHREFCHFLNNARGSLAEVETQISIAQTLGFPKWESQSDCWRWPRSSAKYLMAYLHLLKRAVAE